jgi:hypothetical protein
VVRESAYQERCSCWRAAVECPLATPGDCERSRLVAHAWPGPEISRRCCPSQSAPGRPHAGGSWLGLGRVALDRELHAYLADHVSMLLFEMHEVDARGWTVGHDEREHLPFTPS